MDKLEIPHERALKIIDQFRDWLESGCLIGANYVGHPVIMLKDGEYYITNIHVDGQGRGGHLIRIPENPPPEVFADLAPTPPPPQ